MRPCARTGRREEGQGNGRSSGKMIGGKMISQDRIQPGKSGSGPSDSGGIAIVLLEGKRTVGRRQRAEDRRQRPASRGKTPAESSGGRSTLTRQSPRRRRAASPRGRGGRWPRPRSAKCGISLHKARGRRAPWRIVVRWGNSGPLWPEGRESPKRPQTNSGPVWGHFWSGVGEF
jgi:hypothetical protein